MGFRSASDTETEAFQAGSSPSGSAWRRCGLEEVPIAPAAATRQANSSREAPSRPILMAVRGEEAERPHSRQAAAAECHRREEDGDRAGSGPMSPCGGFRHERRRRMSSATPSTLHSSSLPPSSAWLFMVTTNEMTRQSLQ